MFLRTSARTNVHTDGCGYQLWDMPPLSPFIPSPTFRNNVVVLSSVLGTKTRPLRCFEMPRNTDSLKHHHIPEERIRSTGTVRTAEDTRPSNTTTNISMPSYYCCIRLDAQRKIRNCKLMPDSGVESGILQNRLLTMSVGSRAQHHHMKCCQALLCAWIIFLKYIYHSRKILF